MSVNLYDPTTGEIKNVAGDTINPKSINEMLAPVEDGVASQPYVVGEQFIMSDILYEATSAIAQGDTLTVGTNCQASEKLSKQIDDINESLTANGNRFEAAHDGTDYGFNINNTFYAIGGSGGGSGSNVVPMLDFGNAITITTTNQTTSSDGVLVIAGYTPSGVGQVFINDVQYGRIGSNAGTDTFILQGIPKGTKLKIGATDGNFNCHFVPYIYQSVDPVINVYNEAEVKLNYSTPLHTFSSGNLSYTAVKDCWLVGAFANDTSYATLSINGVVYSSNSSAGTGRPTNQIFLPLSRGDVVTLSATSLSNLHVLEGTVTGSVDVISEPMFDFANPLFTFATDSTHKTYTATHDCWLVGYFCPSTTGNANLLIDNTTIAHARFSNETGGADIKYRIKAGSTVTLSTNVPIYDSLHIFDTI